MVAWHLRSPNSVVRSSRVRKSSIRIVSAVGLVAGLGVGLGMPAGAQTSLSTSASPSQAGSIAGQGAQAGAQRAPTPLARRVSLDLRGARLEAALEEIDRQAKLGLTYTPRVAPLDKRVTLRRDSVTAGAALKEVLRGTGVKVVVTEEGTVMLVKPESGRQSEVRADSVGGLLFGRVVDSVTARPIGGAVVSVKGTDLSVTTNQVGSYLFPKVPAGVQVITVRFLGYMQAEQEIAVVDSQRVRLDFALQMGMSRLQEVVTTATGPQRRMDIANDVTTIQVDSVMAAAPIMSVTDLLSTRVPGLAVLRTSGAPGDPVRLRLRGVSSVYGNNDPIVVVDGIRVYSEQSAERSGNLAALGFNYNPDTLRNPPLSGNSAVAAPSPLDQIDPNMIETIEVLKGPSAATLYGADAANGVVVITTKKGKPGPARWDVSASRGTSEMPGSYPEGIYRFGQGPGGSRSCALTDFTCVADTLVRFQALNDRDLTILGRGSSTRLSLGVSGGSTALTYALRGSFADEIGLLTLPNVEAERYRAGYGKAPPEWMQRPHKLMQWSGTSRLSARLGAKADASLMTTLTRQEQQRSNLERQTGALMSTYVNRATGTYYRPFTAGGILGVADGLVPDFYQRSTAASTKFTNAANLGWRPRAWFTTNATVGLDLISRQDELYVPRGTPNWSQTDSGGALSAAHGSSVVSTVNLRALATAPLIFGFRGNLAVGVNYSGSAIADIATSVRGLAEGTSSMNGADSLVQIRENRRDQASFGLYVEPSLAHKRFTITTGLRLDGGSTFGSNAKLPRFPKVGASWLISDEPFFPFKGVIDVLRLRGAFGAAGVWPRPADQLRLYTSSRPWLDGGPVDATSITTFGNTELRPERSVELEGGFDADLFDNRFSVGLSTYRKTRHDALMSVPLAPSVYGGGSMLKNIGVVRNTGLELTLGTQLVRSDLLTWSASTNLSRNRNVVVELGRGVEPFNLGDAGRVAPGYPLFGRWSKPIVGYSDENADGIIEAREVLLGDTLVYMGETVPNFVASLHTTLSFFRGRLTVGTSLAYEDGLTQVNELARSYRSFARGAVDPSASLGEQAAVVSLNKTNYGITQTVSTLRFNSLSVAYNASPSLARRVGARSLTIALQGSNLGLRSNYAGKDPAVNAYATGNGVADTGQLPQPRHWLLSLRAGY